MQIVWLNLRPFRPLNPNSSSDRFKPVLSRFWYIQSGSVGFRFLCVYRTCVAFISFFKEIRLVNDTDRKLFLFSKKERKKTDLNSSTYYYHADFPINNEMGHNVINVVFSMC